MLVTAGGLRGLLGTGEVGNGSGDSGRAGATGSPGVLGGVCGYPGDTGSQEGAVETRGQVCREPAERGGSGAIPDLHEPPHPRGSEGPAMARWWPQGDGGAGAGTCGRAWQQRLQLGGCRGLCGAGGVVLQQGAAQRRQDGGRDREAGTGATQVCSTRVTAEAGRVPPQDPLGSARDITRPAHGWGGREGLRRGTDVPLSEDEEEMERESSCSCRSTC